MFQREYAWSHSFHDEAQRIIGNMDDPGTCDHGFLCGGACTKPQMTCCI